jgi:DNA-binding XRE family transcriptional regulator
MDATKRRKLKARGWEVGTVAEFLKLTPEESQLIEIKLALSRELKHRRSRGMTQAALARSIGSSQPRVAKAEGGDPSVSADLLIRAILATGGTPRTIAKAIASVRLPS